MLTYNELVAKKNDLLNKKTILEDECKSKTTSKLQYEKELNSIKLDMETSIRRSHDLALKEEISKGVLKYENLISKLLNNRETILSNKQKRLDSITYESYADEVKNGLSIDDCIEKCKDMKSSIELKQGSRLFNVISSYTSKHNSDLVSLEDIEKAFDSIDSKLHKLNNSGDLLLKIESIVFDYNVDVDNKNQLISFILICIIVVGLGIFLTPLLILLMLSLFGYNVYKSHFIYKCIVEVNNIMYNLSDIKSSIEKGINSKMEEDRLLIENKFKSKLAKIDSNVEELENKIIEVTESITNGFHFNSDRLKESFKIKENSLKEKISLLSSEYLNLSASITDLEKDIKDVDLEINKLSRSIFEQYYPKEPKDKSLLYPKDMLIDLVNNKPNIFNLPKGSSCFIFKNEEDLFSYLDLYLTLLYSQMACSSFSVHYYDSKYIGTKSIEFTKLKNFMVYSDKENVDDDAEEMRVEMGKRITLLAGSNVLAYNEEMIAESSVPLSYNIVIDLFTDDSRLSDISKQVIINGFDSGIVYNSFILESQIDFKGNGVFWNMLPLFKDFYLVTSDKIAKKSKSFFENKREK